MFENLQNPNQPNRSQVDDIFADTDQAVDNQPPMRGQDLSPRSNVSAMPAGSLLDSSPDQPEKKGGKGFLLAVIMMSVIILGLLGYLAYSKFFKADDEVLPVDEGTASQEVTEETAIVETELDEATTTASTTTETTGDEFIDFLPVTPGENSSSSEEVNPGLPAEENGGSPVLPAAPVDSDSDSLTDDEEASLGTNPNIIDSDNDGLSDYEEVKIYLTDPLMVDTDKDTYPDGTEVRGGYNPNGEGKLPGNI